MQTELSGMPASGNIALEYDGAGPVKGPNVRTPELEALQESKLLPLNLKSKGMAAESDQAGVGDESMKIVLQPALGMEEGISSSVLSPPGFAWAEGTGMHRYCAVAATNGDSKPMTIARKVFFIMLQRFSGCDRLPKVGGEGRCAKYGNACGAATRPTRVAIWFSSSIAQVYDRWL
jgi:hypothetical protein